MNEITEASPRWAARHDACRPSNSYADLLRIISAYYELYESGTRFLSPWISRQQGSSMPFSAPDKDEIKNAIGKPRSVIHSVIYHSFVNELVNFADRTRGKRQLISPHQTTHHSAQFMSGTFTIEELPKRGTIKRHAITVHGSTEPLYVEGLQLTTDQVNFIIVRPKIGKLGTASVINWEVLFYKSPHSYLINHVDSNLNPTYAGRF